MGCPIKVLVTGASGFVGSRFIKDYGSQYEIFPVSLRSTPVSEIDFDGVDAIVHCAALVHQMKGAPEEEYFRINRDLTLEFARAAKSAGVKHFIFLSTAHVFGDSGSIQDHTLKYDVLSLPCPSDAYGKSKLDAERGLKNLENDDFTVSILRPPMVYGEGAKGNLVALAKLIKKTSLLPLGYSYNKRSIVYVGNLTQAIHLALQAKVSGIFLPQDKNPLSIKQLSLVLARSLQRKIWLIPVPPFVVKLVARYKPKLASRLFGTLWLDSNRTNTLLNFEPAYSSEEGLRRMFHDTAKLKVARTVTVPEAVEFHLRNTLDLLQDEYELEVIGTAVKKFESRWPRTRWTNITISRKISLASDLIALVKLISHFREHRYDIVHSIMPKAGLLTSLAGFITQVPVRLHTFTGQTWANKSGLSKKVFILFDKITVSLCTLCYTDSQSQSEFLFRNGIHINNKPLPVIGDGSLAGVNLERFNPQVRERYKEQFRNKFEIPKAAIVFGFLGRKCEDKGIFELLEAFDQLSKDLPNCYLLLVGPDDDQSFQEQFNLRHSQNSQIISLGFTDTPEEIIAASDVICLPSYREGFGSVIIEAGAMGIPSIGTDIPGLTDAIAEDQTGWLVPKKDVGKLIVAMKKVAEDQQCLLKRGAAAQYRARELFGSRRLFDLLLNEYQLLMEERNIDDLP